LDGAWSGYTPSVFFPAPFASPASITGAIDTAGRIITPRADVSPVKAATVKDIRNEFDRRYVTDETDPLKVGDAKRKAFKRALDQLPVSQFGAGSADGDDWIWRHPS
jgi:hypothetical protein